MTIPERIRARRLALGLTQAEAAERADMAQGYWSRLEGGTRPDRGQTEPTLTTLLRVAHALECGVAALLEQDDD